jgi:hypothetical protein
MANLNTLTLTADNVQPDEAAVSKAGVTGQQGKLTPPRHLIPPLIQPGVFVYPTL